MVIWKFVVSISILMKKNVVIILNLCFVSTFFFFFPFFGLLPSPPPQQTVSIFPEYLETAKGPANVLTGHYGQTVPGGSLSPRQLMYVWDWISLSSPF